MTEPTTDVAGKDTRKGASTLSSDVLDMLTVIRDALDVPLPGVENRDERRFCWLLDDRRSAVYSTLNAILDSSDPTIDEHDIVYIRRRIESTPVTYAVWVDPDPATRNGGAK